MEESGILRKVVGLGLVAVLLVALMYLFALGQVADTTTPAMARALDETFRRALDPDTPSRVTMVRRKTEGVATRHYTVRVTPSEAVAADAAAVERLCERAAELVSGRIEGPRGPVRIVCVAERPGGARVVLAFDRSDSAASGAPAVPALRRAEPAPDDLPAEGEESR